MNKDVDKLGNLRAEIKVYQDKAKELEASIKVSGDLEGKLFHAVLAPAEKRAVNWKKMAMDLGATAIRIAKNTKLSSYVQLRIYAHNKVAKAA